MRPHGCLSALLLAAPHAGGLSLGPSCCSTSSILRTPQPRATESAASSQPSTELSMSDVRAMFRDVRAHYRSTGEVEEAQACRNLMCTRVRDFDKRIAGCEVRPSRVHGDGVFATRDIAEGELVTFFPADALLVWEGGDRKLNDCFMLFGAHGAPRPWAQPSSSTAPTWLLYLMLPASAQSRTRSVTPRRSWTRGSAGTSCTSQASSARWATLRCAAIW